MSKLWAVAVAGLLLVGCGTDPVGNHHVDLPVDATIHPSFDAHQDELVLAAIDDWKRATGGAADVRPSIGMHGTLSIRPVFGTEGDILGNTDIQLGEADMQIDLPLLGSFAAVEKHTPDEVFRDTVMHELGHTFGLQHEPGGLMDADHYGGACVDAVSLDRFCARYGCGSSAAPTCG